MKHLTHRELEIMQLIADGLTTRQAADELGISFYTVKTHIGKILIKLDVHTATSAAVILVRRGDIQ